MAEGPRLSRPLLHGVQGRRPGVAHELDELEAEVGERRLVERGGVAAGADERCAGLGAPQVALVGGARLALRVATGESVIKCPSLLNVRKATYDHRFY
jgi:hypothetical protein